MFPSPTELVYFSEIAQCMSFTKAAEKLAVTQPSLSLAMKKLEGMLGETLLIRKKQGVCLTQAGEQLFSETQSLLQLWERTRGLVKDKRELVRGPVRIGCRSAAAHHLGALLRYLLRTFPGLEPQFHFQTSLGTTEAVIDSSLDIGIVNNPIEHPDLIIHRIDRTDLSLWVAAERSPLQDIHSGEAVILCEPGVPQVRVILRELEKSGVRIARTVHANSLEVIAEFTVNGCGIGVLPSCLARQMYAGRLTSLADTPSCSNQVCIIYRHENRQVAAVRAVLDAMKQAAEGLARVDDSVFQNG